MDIYELSLRSTQEIRHVKAESYDAAISYIFEIYKARPQSPSSYWAEDEFRICVRKISPEEVTAIDPAQIEIA